MIPNYNSPITNVEAALKDSLFSGFPGLATLARTHGLSESRLKRDFKAKYNTTVFAYYRYLQMQLADTYLKEKRCNKKQLAALLNFENPTNFLICYKNYLKNESNKLFTNTINNNTDERYKLFVTQAPFAFAMFDKDLNFLAASKKWIDDHQLQEKLAPGQYLYNIFPDLEKKWLKIHKSALKGKVHNGESEFVSPIRSTIWLRWDIRPWYRDEQNIGGLLFYSEDITAYKIKAEENEKILETLEKTSSIIKIGTWKRNFVSKVVYWSKATRDILEISEADQPDFELALHYYKPVKSRELMTKVIDEAIKFSKSFDVKADLITAKGNLKRVRVVGYADFINGRCEKLFGIFQDITKK